MQRRIIISVILLLIPVVLAILIFVLPRDSFLPKMFLGDARKAKKIQRAIMRFQRMTPEQSGYREFHHNYEFFYREGEGKEEQRNRLRTIRNRIESDPLAPVLNVQLTNYYNWLKTVPQEKTKIDQAKTIEERLKIIREIKGKQDRLQRLQDNFSDSYWTNVAVDFDFLDSESNEDEDVYPTNAELASFLESLEPRQLEAVLGTPPDMFRYELHKAYQRAREDSKRSD